MKKMSDLSLKRRVIAYLVILVGYFFYCYNFVVIDYVRPFLVEFYGIKLEQTALFYTAQSLGALIGAFACAWLAENKGKKNTLIAITLLNGVGTLINISSRDFTMWILMRFIIGISLGGYFTVAVSTMVGLFDAKVRGKVTAFASGLFSVATLFMGVYGAILKEKGWEMLMVVGGLPPVIAAVLMFFLIPDEKEYLPYGSEELQNNSKSVEEKKEVKKGSWGEMFSPKLRRFTFSCMFLAALNFFGYQFFSGFVTTYLREVRAFDAVSMGIIFSAISMGSLVGAYSWGIIADKYGRKVNAIGFIMSAIMIALFFIAPSNPKILSVAGFFYGLGLASSAIWGGYFTELFPSHLKSMGASLFHAARIFSLFAPSILVSIKKSTSLQTAMWGAPLMFLIAAIVWLSLPETLKKENK